MKRLYLLALVLVLSLSGKYIRYTSPMPDEAEVTERLTLKLGAAGWQLEKSLAMNTNKTSNLLVYRKNGCGGYLYLTLSGRDASNVAIFKQFLGREDIAFLLSDRLLEQGYYFWFFYQHLINLVKNAFAEDAHYYSPLILVYDPFMEGECSFLEYRSKKRLIMDIHI